MVGMQGLSLRESSSKKPGLAGRGRDVSGFFLAGEAGVPDSESENESSGSTLGGLISVLFFSP